MNGNVTISIRSILATGVVLIGLVTAYLLGDAGGGGEARAADQPVVASATAADRTLTMVGKGQATAVPDQLVFALAVGATRPDLETALDSASRTMDRVLAALEPYGVKRADVQSTGLSMYPVYDYHAYSPPTLRGYRVSQRASVLVKELKMGGRAVSAAVAAGGNAVRVNDIKLRVGDPEAVMEQARDAAVAEATAKATQYAEATGQELGEVLTLREVTTSNRSANQNRTYELDGLMRTSSAIKAMPIRAGKQDLGVTVQVVWEFA
ncbi:MAG: hypothetical protein JWO76_2788 [Nocardioides sp.]|nr:hypothetical protein [Nocardioides sp.]